MADDILEHINTVECHVKWKPEKYDGMPEDLSVMEQKLLHDIEDNSKIQIFALTLLVYIFTEGDGKGRGVDFKKAKYYAQQARHKSKNNGEKVVAIANSMHLFNKCQKTEELEQLHMELKSFAKLSVHDICRIKLTHAFALSRFGQSAYKRALELYKDVIKVEENPDAHFGLGLLIGRIRRYNHGNNSKPSEHEIKALQTACVLWDNKDAHSLVWYGYAKTQLLLFQCKNESRDVSRIDIQGVVNILDNAKWLADNRPECSCIIYKWCAKGYKYLNQISPSQFTLPLQQKQKDCIDRAVSSNPNDSSILHEAGIFYFRARRFKNVELSKAYLEKSSKVTQNGNFWAEVDFCKFYVADKIEYLAQMLEKYNTRELNMEYRIQTAILHMFIGLEHQQKDNVIAAEKAFWKAIEADRATQQVGKAKNELLSIIRKKQKLNLCVKENMKVLNQLGCVYYMTGDYKEASQNYMEAMALGGAENGTEKDEALKKLCEIHYKLEAYNNCIEMGYDQCDKYPSLKEYVAKSFYKMAQKHKNSHFDVYKENLLKSAGLGLLNAGKDFITLTKGECMNNQNLCLTKKLYEDMAILHCWFSHEGGQYWSLENGETPEVAKAIAKGARTLVLSQPGHNQITHIHNRKLRKTRKLRFEMARKKVGKGKSRCWDVLVEARCQLDGCFFRYKKSHPEYSKVNKRGYYPFTPKAKTGVPSESTQDLANTETFLKKKLEEEMKLEQFSSKEPDLFDFLCRHQAYYSTKFDFVPEFVNLVNKKKHEDQDEETDENYELAHSACMYVEELAIELSKHTVPIS